MTGLTVEGNQMTEVSGDQGLSNFAVEPVTSSPVSTPTPVEERTFRQSEVNDIASRRASEAVERFKRETSIASHQQPQTGYGTPAYQPANVTQQPQSGISEDNVRRMAAEETQRLRNEWTLESQRNAQEQDAQRIASEFFTKIEAGKANLQDFDKVMADVDLRSIPYHVQLANMVDNTAEVMYELAQNPSKIGAIQNLIDLDLRAGRQPKLALSEMKKLSQSIKDNGKAASFKSPNEPLSQLKPSNAGTDTRDATIKDYKSRYII